MPLAVWHLINIVLRALVTGVFFGPWLGLSRSIGAALLITLIVEVPIDNRIKRWTTDTLPAEWPEIRDRWERFHVLRTLASVAGLVFLVAGALFGR